MQKLISNVWQGMRPRLLLLPLVGLISVATAGESFAVFAQASSSSGADNVTKERRKSDFLKQIDAGPDKVNLGVAYWIELNRQGRIYRTSNQAKFQSGDQIRFHVLPNADAFTYIVMHKGTSGGKSVLFPPTDADDNLIKGGAECIVPREGSLEFDQNPGIEQVGLLVSRSRIEPVKYLDQSLAAKNPSRDIGSKSAHLTRASVNTGAAGSPDAPRDDSDSMSDLEKAYDAVLSSSNPGALEVLPSADTGEKAERVLASPSTDVIVSENPDDVVTVNFALTHN